MLYEKLFLIALFFTLMTEVPVAIVFLRYKYKNIKISDVLFIGILASTLTLPYLWFVLPGFISNRIAYQIVGEILVFIVEAFIYFKFLKVKLLDAFIVSLIANTVSVTFGFLVFGM